ncbi:MAG: hypothetical protein FJ303_01930 [Planctomycetes bacterium]|nr:hypothetical protein [Planctomycetota bacterium]
MLKSVIATFALGTLGVICFTGFAEQQGEKDKGPKKEKKGWEPGKLIPPHIRDGLDLTEDQQRKITELEQEVRAKLLKILTEQQLQRVKELDKGPKGPPREGDGAPEKKGKGKGKKEFDRPDGPPVRAEERCAQSTSWQRHPSVTDPAELRTRERARKTA